MRTKLIFWLAISMFFTACTGKAAQTPGGAIGAASSNPRAWIDQPLEGSAFPFGQPVTIRWHASAGNGLEQVEVQISGQPFASHRDFEAGALIVTAEHSWNPEAPGEYMVAIIPTGSDGITGAIASNRVVILAHTPTPTSTPTSTPTPTFTPSPTATITPTPPPDTQGPPAPVIIGPTGNSELDCFKAVVLEWQDAKDPSGISSYRVRLQRKLGSAWVDVMIWDPLAKTRVDASDVTDCGRSYRWRVAARDGAGNTGESAEWARFSIILP